MGSWRSKGRRYQNKQVDYPVYRRSRLECTAGPQMQGLLGGKRLATVNLLAFLKEREAMGFSWKLRGGVIIHHKHRRVPMACNTDVYWASKRIMRLLELPF